MAETNNFKGVVGLTEEQYNTLQSTGTLVVGDVTYIYDPTGTLYVTDSEGVTIDNVTITKNEQGQIQVVAITDGAEVKEAKDIAVTNKENTFTKTQTFTSNVDNEKMVTFSTKYGNDILWVSSGTNRTATVMAASNIEFWNGNSPTYIMTRGYFSPRVMPTDLGANYAEWNNLYLANNLSDGTNSATIAQIVEALTIERLGE